MLYLIFRLPVLMEDEGREFYEGTVDAASRKEAKETAERLYGGNYFHSSDYKAIEKE